VIITAFQEELYFMVLGYPAKHTLQSKRLSFPLYQRVEQPFTPLVNVILNSQ
jgi:hypothetical protein